MYAEIVAADPLHADALHLLGVLAGQTGRAADAVAWLRRSVAVRPDHAEACKNLGVALKAIGQLDAAIASYEDAIALKPDYAEAHRNLGAALYQTGRLEEAIAAYRQAITFQPDFADAHSSLGVALRKSGQLEAAIAACRSAITFQPGDPLAHNNLGNALHDAGRSAEAIATYRFALRLQPDFAQAWNNLGIALKTLGEIAGAIAAYQNAVQSKPDYADAFANLAHALKDEGRIAEAIVAFRQAVELRPDSPEWRHVLAALCGDDSSPTTPAGYVRQLFDPYADTFDAHLVGELGYRVPQQLFEAMLALAPGRHFDILDLGCGTGLCGAAFRSISKSTLGVDLSPAMIAKARARGCYDRLITADLCEAMRAGEHSFDLILAADVFIYVGDLRDVFAAARRALRGGGWFAFSLERYDGEGFTLHSKIRFAHSLAYIRDLARAHDFAELSVQEITIRKSGAEDVAGCIVVLENPAAFRL